MDIWQASLFSWVDSLNCQIACPYTTGGGWRGKSIPLLSQRFVITAIRQLQGGWLPEDKHIPWGLKHWENILCLLLLFHWCDCFFLITNLLFFLAIPPPFSAAAPAYEAEETHLSPDGRDEGLTTLQRKCLSGRKEILWKFSFRYFSKQLDCWPLEGWVI